MLSEFQTKWDGHSGTTKMTKNWIYLYPQDTSPGHSHLILQVVYVHPGNEVYPSETSEVVTDQWPVRVHRHVSSQPAYEKEARQLTCPGDDWKVLEAVRYLLMENI